MRTLLVTVALAVARSPEAAHMRRGRPTPTPACSTTLHSGRPPSACRPTLCSRSTMRCVRLYPREIEESTVLAMYADNRAAEALAGQRLDDAHAWAREALRHDAAFASAWNTLGVACLRRGEAACAAAVFEHALAVANSSTRREHGLYAAKHAWLGSASRP